MHYVPDCPISFGQLAFNFGTSQLPVFSRQLFRSLGVWEFLDSQFVVKAVAKKIQSAAWLSSSCCLNPSRPLTSPYSLWSLWCCRTMQNQLSGFWMVLAVPLAGCGWACVDTVYTGGYQEQVRIHASVREMSSGWASKNLGKAATRSQEALEGRGRYLGFSRNALDIIG